MAISLWDLKRLETNQVVDGNSAQTQACVIIAEAKAIFRVFLQLHLDVRKSFFPTGNGDCCVYLCLPQSHWSPEENSHFLPHRMLRVCLPVP